MLIHQLKKSVNNKIWQQYEINEDHAVEIARKLDVSDLLARIISVRVDKLDEVEYFFTSKVKHQLPDPFHLIDMQKAVDRTIDAIKRKQKICIFADYDVDGATSAAVLKNLFRDLAVEVDIYVPDRISEGYGPTISAVQKIREQEVSLLITVDCGSMAHEAIRYASSLDIDVIVIDHHISTGGMEGAVAVINPNRVDEPTLHKDLAAVGVCFLFSVALVSALTKIDYFNPIPVPNLINYLDLVALGTVCDVVPITNLNRALVSTGLKIMACRQNVGIKALCDVALVQEKLSCYHLGFVLGPRINAGGRVGKSSKGAYLLSSDSEEEAREMAIELEQYNAERKTIEISMLEEAIRTADMQKNNSLLFIVGENWHPGIIGIIASKLKERFNKPVVVVSLSDGIGKGSCRSVRGIDLGKKIIEAQNRGLILAGGGHAMAAGFTASEESLNKVSQFLNDLIAPELLTLEANSIEKYDAELTTSAATVELIEELKKLEPYGHGNSEPIFKFSNLFVLKADIVGNTHIRMLLAPDKDAYGYKALSAIVFNGINTPMHDVIFSKKPYQLSVLGMLRINTWRDSKRVQLHVKDVIVQQLK